MWRHLKAETSKTGKKAVLAHLLDPSNVGDKEVNIFLSKQLATNITTQNFGFVYTTAYGTSHHGVTPYSDPSFINPNQSAKHDDTKHLPVFFQSSLLAKTLFVSCADANLNVLNVDMLQQCINGKMLDTLLEEHNKERLANNEEVLVKKDCLKLNGHMQRKKEPKKMISHSTVNHWISEVGHSHDPVRKHYFNNKHNQPKNVIHRNAFIVRHFACEKELTGGFKSQRRRLTDQKERGWCTSFMGVLVMMVKRKWQNTMCMIAIIFITSLPICHLVAT